MSGLACYVYCHFYTEFSNGWKKINKGEWKLVGYVGSGAHLDFDGPCAIVNYTRL